MESMFGQPIVSREIDERRGTEEASDGRDREVFMRRKRQEVSLTSANHNGTQHPRTCKMIMNHNAFFIRMLSSNTVRFHPIIDIMILGDEFSRELLMRLLFGIGVNRLARFRDESCEGVEKSESWMINSGRKRRDEKKVIH
jgi:hypothetical protein